MDDQQDVVVPASDPDLEYGPPLSAIISATEKLLATAGFKEKERESKRNKKRIK